MSLQDRPDNEPTERLTPEELGGKPASGLEDTTVHVRPAAITPPPQRTSRRLTDLPLIPGYELIGELGRGGMGVVYKANHQTLKRTVAIKMLPPDELIDAIDVARFCSEAEAVAAIKHPNVVQVFEFAIKNDRPYMAMEYLSGGSLSMKLRRARKPMSADEAAGLLEKLARGVQAAHAQGIVHRDLKPGNVLYDQAGEPRVTDFGLAKRVTSDLTKTKTVMGTPAYMAPEQASGRTKYTGPAADIYALGAILYECLTGDPPFGRDGDSWQIINRVINDPPTKPRERVAEIPRDLELICLRCLEKEPDHRYSTASALADDLLRFLNHEPVSVRPPGMVERGVKWARRRPTTATAYGLGILVVCMTFVGAIIVTLWINAIDAKRKTEFVNQEVLNEKDKAELAQSEAEKVSVKLAESLKSETNAKDQLNKTQNDLITTKYFHDVSLAYREFGDGNHARADQLLNACPKEFRGWEWWHCYRTVHPELVSFTLARPHYLAFNSTGNQLVTCQQVEGWIDHEFEFRDAITGNLIRKVPVNTQRSEIKWLSHNGTRLLETFNIYNKADPFKVDERVARVWDTSTGKIVGEWKELKGDMPQGCISGDGSTIIVGGDGPGGRVQAIDVNTGKKLAELNLQTSTGAHSSITSDGRLALTVINDEQNYVFHTIWETKSGKVLHQLRHVHNNQFVWMLNTQLSPDGSHVVFLSDRGHLGFWKLGQPAAFKYLLGVHTGQSSSNLQIVFSQDGQLVATVGDEGTIRLWKTSTGEPVATYQGHRGKIRQIAFSSRGDRFITRDESGLCKVWPTGETGTVSHFATPGPWAVPVSVDDRATKMFVPFTGDPEKAALHEREHGTTQYITKTTSPYIHEHIFQPGGKLFATAPGWQCVELRDSTTGHVVQSFSLPQNHGVTLSFSQNGNRLLAACDSKELVVWDVKAGKKLRTIASNWAHRGAISGDGKRVACADFAHIAEVFDVESGAKLATVLPNLDAECNAIALNHDGTQMATGSKSWKIYLFEIPAMVGPQPVKIQPRSELLAHSAAVNSLAFSKRGDRLISGSEDGTVKVFDPRTGLEAIGLKLPERTPVYRIQISPDEHRIIIMGKTKGAFIFDGTPQK